VTEETLVFLHKEMIGPEGGFFASMDADTPDGEGRYYAWKIEGLHDLLSDDEFTSLQKVTGLSQIGNFEPGLSVLQLNHGDLDNEKHFPSLQIIFQKLKAARDQRMAPGKDQKIITEWNAMTIRAFAEAGLILNQAEYLQIAKNAAKFIIENLTSYEGKLFRSWRAGNANQPGTLADYAALIAALHAVYAIDFDPQIYNQMRSLFSTLQEDFSSEDDLYYDASAHVTDLVIRPRNLQDNATPSGNAMAAYAHWLFASYEHDLKHQDQATRMIQQAGIYLEDYPTSFGHWLQVAGLLFMDTQQIALVSPGDLRTLQPFLETYRRTYRPYSIISSKYAGVDGFTGQLEIFADRPAIDGKPTAYVCQGFICQEPVTDPHLFQQQIDQ
jgi:hypothetical protein